MRAAALAIALVSLAARAEQELPTYPGTVHTRIGNDLVIDGEYYRIAYFTTADSPEKVADYFFQQWKHDGYPTTVDGDPRNGMVVSAFYTREGLQRSVVLTTHEGKTLGFSVLKDLWASPAPSKPEHSLPKLEGALFAQDLASREDTGGAQSRGTIVSASLDTARARLLAQLGKAGYRLTRESGGHEAGKRRVILELSRGAGQVVSVLTEIDSDLTAVMQTWVEGARR